MNTRLWWIAGFMVAAPLTMIAAFTLLWNVQFSNAVPVLAYDYAPAVSMSNTQVLASRTNALPTWDLNFDVADGRAMLTVNYLRRYNSPLLPYADDIVIISDKYGLDWRLLIAIAQQESNLCKKIPENSYNCWGYGIYGGMVTRFGSYSEGLETVARGLKRNYLDKGLDTPEKIMAKYTPPSQGSWALGVNQFLAEIQ